MKSRILIKIGGRAFEGEPGFKELAAAIKSSHGMELIIVHGGGAEISRALKNAKRETKFIDGIRVTRAEDIRIGEDVLSGIVNLRIASWLSGNGVECQRRCAPHPVEGGRSIAPRPRRPPICKRPPQRPSLPVSR